MGANRLPYCPEDDINLPPSIGHMSFIQLTCAEVLEELKAIDPKKACGPDNIPGRILKGELRPEISRLHMKVLTLIKAKSNVFL